jgi:hypothetical protein
MKLNSAQVKQTLSQYDAEVLPDDHPAVAQLNNLFGDHRSFSTAADLRSWSPPTRRKQKPKPARS